MSGPASLRGSELRLFIEYFNRGVKFLSDVPDLSEIAVAVGFQHEHFDGNGFPGSLAGERIPLHSRIVAIADAYDEMREPRLPVAGFDHENALTILRSAAGRKYDPVIVALFCDLNFRESGRCNAAFQPVENLELVSHA